MDNDTTNTYRCKSCGIEYPLTSEYWHRSVNIASGFQTQCKTCRRAKNRKWNADNRERCQATMRAWRVENKEHEKQYSLSDKSRTSSKRWNSNNPEAMRAIKLKYRARKRALPDNFTQHHWGLCLDYWHNTCATCGKQLRDLFGNIEPHADHWHPLNQPGCPGTVPENMVCLCNSCNKSKNDRMPDDWLIWKFGEHKAKKISSRIRKYFDWIKSQ